jgi:hypothetical protein
MARAIAPAPRRDFTRPELAGRTGGSQNQPVPPVLAPGTNHDEDAGRHERVFPLTWRPKTAALAPERVVPGTLLLVRVREKP